MEYSDAMMILRRAEQAEAAIAQIMCQNKIHIAISNMGTHYAIWAIWEGKNGAHYARQFSWDRENPGHDGLRLQWIYDAIYDRERLREYRRNRTTEELAEENQRHREAENSYQ